MLEIPFLEEIVEEKTRETARETARRDIVTLLEARFGEVPQELVEGVESVAYDKRLKGLMRSAAACADLAAFREAIARS